MSQTRIIVTEEHATTRLTVSPIGVPSTSIDHGRLIGLSDDDHTQYHNDARGDARYVSINGGTMVGPLLLPSADPSLDLQAVHKKYVDDEVAVVAASATAANNKADDLFGIIVALS
jgi:hypothetical protein